MGNNGHIYDHEDADCNRCGLPWSDNSVCAGNSVETAKVIGRPFPKGVSGNPSGRPKDTLKAFISRELRDMSDDEKREWIKKHKITGIDQWKMGEGMPKQDVAVEGEIDFLIKADE